MGEKLRSYRCGTPSDSSEERVAASMLCMHMVQQSMYMRGRRSHHFDVKVVDKACNHFEDVCLGFNQTLVDCHLEVTVKNFDELFYVEANAVRGKVEQCSSLSFPTVVCSQSPIEAGNHCNQS